MTTKTAFLAFAVALLEIVAVYKQTSQALKWKNLKYLSVTAIIYKIKKM